MAEAVAVAGDLVPVERLIVGGFYVDRFGHIVEILSLPETYGYLAEVEVAVHAWDCWIRSLRVAKELHVLIYLPPPT